MPLGCTVPGGLTISSTKNVCLRCWYRSAYGAQHRPARQVIQRRQYGLGAETRPIATTLPLQFRPGVISVNAAVFHTSSSQNAKKSKDKGRETMRARRRRLAAAKSSASKAFPTDQDEEDTTERGSDSKGAKRGRGTDYDETDANDDSAATKSKSKPKKGLTPRRVLTKQTKDPIALKLQEQLVAAQVGAPRRVHAKSKKTKDDDLPTDQEDFKTLKAAMTEGASGRHGVRADRGTLASDDMHFEAIRVHQPPVPNLAHGLERALFNPGVYHVQDPRSGVYNFDPYLEKLMPVAEFDFNTLSQFMPPSKDPTLASIAQKREKKYVGSTSSMTGVLKHFHFLLSRWRKINTSMLSKDFPATHDSFTKLSRGPDAIFLRWKNGTYAIDADKEYDGANVLSMMGKYMEKLLTIDKDTFEKHRVGKSHLLTSEEVGGVDSFHYSTLGDFLIRSQLDAHDARLPGTGMFDLKTRAVIPIRMDSADFEWGMDYNIRKLQGEWESFEREYFDMMRSTMLKYSLQVRMGRMDGIFVAYHNIARIFGFQYISIEEMDRALHGQVERCLGDCEFMFSLALLNKVFDRAIEKFPKQSIRLHFETREGTAPFMYIFAEPVTEMEANEIQSTNKAKIEAWERSMLGLDRIADDKKLSKDPSAIAESTEGRPAAASQTNSNTSETQPTSIVDIATNIDEEITSSYLPEVTTTNESMESQAPSDEQDVESLAKQDTMVEEDALDAAETKSDGAVAVGTVYEVADTNTEEAISDSADTSASLIDLPSEDSHDPADAEFLTGLRSGDEQHTRYPKGVLAMALTVKSYVNGAHVKELKNLSPNDSWTLQYELGVFEKEHRAATLYTACKERRKKIMDAVREEESSVDERHDHFRTLLRDITAKSRQWRLDKEKREQKAGVEGAAKMWNDSTPKPSGDVTEGMPISKDTVNVDGYLGWLYSGEAGAQGKRAEV